MSYTANQAELISRHARSVHEQSRDVAREIAKTPQYKQSRRDRKKLGMLFAHLKRILKLDRLRLRGLSGARDEFLLAATAQNLRRMGKWLMASQQAARPTTAQSWRGAHPSTRPPSFKESFPQSEPRKPSFSTK